MLGAICGDIVGSVYESIGGDSDTVAEALMEMTQARLPADRRQVLQSLSAAAG